MTGNSYTFWPNDISKYFTNFIHFHPGEIPIMIGHKCVDPLTGELSPISGVRVRTDTDTIVPVTLSSGGHRKRKPQLGAVAMLEDEVVARRSFWRRQRQRETEITQLEFKLAHQMLHGLDTVKLEMTGMALDNILDKAQALDDASKREVQRRADATREFTSVLPPDVVTVLVEGDESERRAEETHGASHGKFVEIVRKFVQKLQDEEKLYKDRLDELIGSLNPDAERVVHQRYQQARSRLVTEMRGHVISKMEMLDEHHATLQYARERSEILALEAKAVLTGNLAIAGDYDCTLVGIYGDLDLSLQQGAINEEMVPLLKQLIALLESGQSFVMAPAITNVNIHKGMLNITGANVIKPAVAKQVMGAAPTTAGPRPVAVTTTRLVQHDAGQTTTVVTPDDSLNSDIIVIDPEKLKPSSAPMNDSERQSRIRDLATKQMYEAAKLENNLRSGEIKSTNDVLDGAEAKKRGVTRDLTHDLKTKLSAASSQTERDKIMLEYSSNLQKLTDALEKQKQGQLRKLRAELLEKRRKGKKDLHQAHVTEAGSLGMPADVVPNIVVPTHAELEHDLYALTQQQEALTANLQQTAAEQEERLTPIIDIEEMEGKLRALGLGHEAEETILQVGLVILSYTKCWPCLPLIG